MTKKLDLPKFRNEGVERDFWSKFDLSDHFASNDFVNVSFPNLKPTSSSISIRVPDYLLARLKERAHELNIPYQSLMKQYIAKGILTH
jgi:predicted DNA binding CopG/RHH family protein